MAKLLRVLLAAAISAAALIGAVRLIAPADTASSVRRQLIYLREELDSGAATEAQRSFPEGYFFLYALYGLTQVDLGLTHDGADSLREARWALSKLESDEGRAPFAADLEPSYGVFYRGWVNWLRGGILALQPAATRDRAEVSRFEEESAALGAAFDASATPFLAAYPGQAWPVDSVVAVASLTLHDKLLTPRYETTVIRWTANVRADLDPATGLIPHTADVDTGDATSGARGSSQSIIQRFLPEIDPEFARRQYALFRTWFLTAPLGIGPAVREFPQGVAGQVVAGQGDADSGPLLLGVSLPATAVTLGAAKVQGDTRLADALANFGEVAGLPLDTWQTRRYAFGAVPIGDAFLAWSKSATPWVAAPMSAPTQAVSRWWRLPLLTLFLLIGTAPWLILAVWRRRRATAI
ncbi:hypothetical protein ACWKSP_12760 [Micromonosporaceae bacterium Da 78-11]